jgi:hypothetical protein
MRSGADNAFFNIDSANLRIFYIIRYFYRINIVDTERQYVAVVDGIYDGVCMEPVAECLRSCFQKRVASAAGIYRKNRRTSETKEVIIFECLNYFSMHLSKWLKNVGIHRR